MSRPAALTLAFCLLLSQQAGAGPADAYGLGTRGRAMGSAMTATTHDFAASYYNPARLTYAHGVELTGGYSTAIHNLEVNGGATPIDDVSGATFGLVVNGSMLGVPLALGLATTLDGRRLTRLGEVRAYQPEWVRYKSRNRALLFAANLALRPLPWLAFGGGITFLASSEGSFDVQGVLTQGAPGIEYDSMLEHSVDYALTRRVFPQVGVSVAPYSGWTLGLTYREERQVQVQVQAGVGVDVQVGDVAIPATYGFSSRSTDGFVPRDVTLGVAYEFSPAMTASVDVSWAQWSRYPTPLATTHGVLRVGENGANISTDVLPPALVAHDLFIPRFGFEYLFLQGGRVSVPVRAGYYFEDSPVENPTPTNFVDAPRHVVSVGSGVALNGVAEWMPGVTLGLDVNWSLFSPTTVTHEPPATSECCTESQASGNLVSFAFEVGLVLD